MLDISFLRNGGRGGLEFIDFQKNDYAKKLVAAIEPHLIEKNGVLTLQASVAGDILPIIEEYDGWKNITVEMMDDANFAVDVGFMSPNNILNIKNIDHWYDVTETTLHRWYAKNKSAVFKGRIDYRNGKVEGSYADLPIKLYLGRPVGHLFKNKDVQKLGITAAEAVAGCIAHEMGHCFFNASCIDTMANDNFVIRGALAHLGAVQDKEKRVLILRNAASLLDASVDKKDDLESIAGNDRVEETVVYLNALVARRNTKRALSVGVAEMTSEVAADMFAVRKGFDRGIIATLSIFGGQRVKNILVMSSYMSFLIGALFINIGVVVPAVFLMFFATGAVFSFVLSYAVFSFSGTYNSPFRRFEDAVRQMIAKLKTVDMPAKDRLDLANTLTELLKQVEAYKPVIAGTFVDRFLGTLAQGGDYKRNEFEHFTQAIANSELEVLNVKINSLTA